MSEQMPPQGFHAPKWTGSEWVEGKPEAEIVEAMKAAKVEAATTPEEVEGIAWTP